MGGGASKGPSVESDGSSENPPGKEKSTERPKSTRQNNRPKSGKAPADQSWELLTYMPPYGEKFEFSHTHYLYTNDLERLEDIPPPHTAPTRKHEIFDPDRYIQVDERTDSLKDQALEKPLTELVKLLTGDYEDEISKARALYRWFTSQPIETADYKKSAKPNTAMGQLWYLKNKRNTYAGFFSLLCWYAEIPCAIIRGYLKGSTYEVGQKIDKELHRGEWNAVLIDGNWRLVNAFWGACVLSGDEDEESSSNYFYTCDENFFLTDPQQLIYTHFPEDDNWQLLDDKKSIQEFETMVFLKDRFFNLEMRVLSHPLCSIEADDGEVNILFGLHPEKSGNHTFLCIPTYFIDKKHSRSKPVELPQQNVQLDFIHRSNENVLSVKVRFPKVGTYKLEIVGKDTTIKTPEYDFDWVAIYKVNVNSVPENQTFFPITEAVGWGPGKNLEDIGIAPLSHTSGEINMKPGPVSVKFKIVDEDKFKKAGVRLGYQMLPIGTEDDSLVQHHPFQRTGDILEADFTLPEGEFKMRISHASGEGDERNVCNYHVMSKVPPPPKAHDTAAKKKANEPDEEDMLRKKLHEAIESSKLEELERTVDLVESKGYASKLANELREAKDLIARLKRLQKLIHEVMTLNQRTIAEIRSYSNPIAEIHVCMRATLLLLGHTEEETKDWKNVQAIIGKTGKMSLKRRIGECDVNKLKRETVMKTKALLKNIKLEDVVIISAGAATFYTWSNGMAEEFDQRQKEK